MQDLDPKKGPLVKGCFQMFRYTAVIYNLNITKEPLTQSYNVIIG